MVGYLVTIDPHLLSSPHVQPVLFFILSSLPLLIFLSLLFISTLSSYVYTTLTVNRRLLFLSFLSPTCPALVLHLLFFFLLNGVCLHFFTPFCLMSPSVFASSIPFSIPSIHSLHFTYTLGLLFIIKVFSHPHSFLSLCASRSFLPCSPPYFFFHCPLIFMRLTGQPHSASLSLSVGEEAAQCQQLMDFWRTQTAMHHSPENYIGRKRRRIWREAKGRVIWDREGNKRMRERVIAKEKNKVRGSSQAIHGRK